MRNISFFLTTAQFLSGAKCVTRRLGWARTAPIGKHLMGVEKGQGIAAGGLVRFGAIEIMSNDPEPLQRMIDEPEYGEMECLREGFPWMSPTQFVDMFCEAQQVEPCHHVNRIWFRHLDLHQGVVECPRCLLLLPVRVQSGNLIACHHCGAGFHEKRRSVEKQFTIYNDWKTSFCFGVAV